MGNVTYQITHKSGAKMLFKYDLNGFLVAHSSEFKMTEKTVSFYRAKFPFLETDLLYYKSVKEFRVEKIETDLSFTAFWNLYAHKVGNKKRAQKLWEALSDNDRAKALTYIKRYNNQLLGAPGIQKLHPETYLYQKRFDNE